MYISNFSIYFIFILIRFPKQVRNESALVHRFLYAMDLGEKNIVDTRLTINIIFLIKVFKYYIIEIKTCFICLKRPGLDQVLGL